MTSPTSSLDPAAKAESHACRCGGCQESPGPDPDPILVFDDDMVDLESHACRLTWAYSAAAQSPKHSLEYHRQLQDALSTREETLLTLDELTRIAYGALHRLSRHEDVSDLMVECSDLDELVQPCDYAVPYRTAPGGPEVWPNGYSQSRGRLIATLAEPNTEAERWWSWMQATLRKQRGFSVLERT